MWVCWWTVAGQEAVLQGAGVSARGVVAEVGGLAAIRKQASASVG